jgi:Holliday junction resolvase RusA-like endonuclease
VKPNPGEVSFTVYGTPRPQGSMRAFMRPGARHPVLVSDNKKMRPWRQEIAGTAAALDIEPFADGVPLMIEANFFFKKPKSARKRADMTVKPDVDKLCRAVLDALKGVVIHDDAQVVWLFGIKHYGETERAEIIVVAQEALQDE